jgi:hypothetical protein
MRKIISCSVIVLQYIAVVCISRLLEQQVGRKNFPTWFPGFFNPLTNIIYISKNNFPLTSNTLRFHFKMQFREIFAVYSANHVMHMNKFWRQYAEFFNVRTRGTHSYHRALKN